MIFALVIHPAYAECKHSFRFDHAVEQVGLDIFGMRVDDGGKRRKNFFNGLDKFRLVAVLFLHILDDTCNICIHFGKSSSKKYQDTFGRRRPSASNDNANVHKFQCLNKTKIIKLDTKTTDDIHNLRADALLRLHGRRADMRRAGDHRMAVERMVLCRLFRIDVQTRCANLAGLESGKQRVLIHVRAARGVDNDDAVFHLRNALCVDERAAVNGGCVDGDEIGLREQLVHLDIWNTKLRFDARDVEDIKRHDVHADGVPRRED